MVKYWKNDQKKLKVFLKKKFKEVNIKDFFCNIIFWSIIKTHVMVKKNKNKIFEKWSIVKNIKVIKSQKWFFPPYNEKDLFLFITVDLSMLHLLFPHKVAVNTLK